MTRGPATFIKFGIFAVIMALLTVFLFFTFGQYRTGSTNGYSAVFTDASRLKTGDTVRVAGIRVGTVTDVSLDSDRRVLVDFDADQNIKLTDGTKAAIRYLNLTGDRFLELVDAPGSTRLMPPGAQIPVDRTEPALDLDLLLSGLKPVIQGLNPQDVNALTSSLVQVFQGQGGTIDSLLSKTSSFSNTLADHNQTVQQLIDNLNQVLGSTVLYNASSNYLVTHFKGGNAQNLLSDYYISNASFLRMDNATIGYNLGRIDHTHANLRLNAGVQNVFVITKYKGLDPEIAAGTGNTPGIDNNLYPRPRTYFLGLNLDF